MDSPFLKQVKNIVNTGFLRDCFFLRPETFGQQFLMSNQKCLSRGRATISIFAFGAVKLFFSTLANFHH